MGYSRKKLNLIGQRYGNLIVLAPTENINGRTAWQCRCDCGREVVVKTAHLRNDHVTTCGTGCNLHENEKKIGGLSRLTYVDGTCVEMLRSSTVRKNNTSGVPGVDWRDSKGCWRATLCFKGKRYYLGSFTRIEDAIRARKEAEERLVKPFLAEYEKDSTVYDGVSSM